MADKPTTPTSTKIQYSLVPFFVQKVMKEQGGTAHKTRKLLRFVPMRKETCTALNIIGAMDKLSAEWDALNKSLLGSSAGSIVEFGGTTTTVFNGLTDTTGTQRTRKTGFNVKAVKGYTPSGITATIKTVKPVAAGKTTLRTVSFTFPKIFTRLMILQAISSMIPVSKSDDLKKKVRIEGVTYPIIFAPQTALWAPSDCGAWALATPPNKDLFTTDDPDIPGDSPDNVNELKKL